MFSCACSLRGFFSRLPTGIFKSNDNIFACAAATKTGNATGLKWRSGEQRWVFTDFASQSHHFKEVDIGW